MERIFWQILQMSVTASVAIAAVMLLRLALRRVPRVFSYMLWAAVLFRLLCPVAVESPLSLFWLTELSQAELFPYWEAELYRSGDGRPAYVNQGQRNAGAGDAGTMFYAADMQIAGDAPSVPGDTIGVQAGVGVQADKGHADAEGAHAAGEQADAQADKSAEGTMEAQMRAGAEGMQADGEQADKARAEKLRIFGRAGIVWLCGVLAMALYGTVSSLRFRRVLRGSVRNPGGAGTPVFRAELPTAFVYGLVRPCIYLPEGLLPSEEEYILLHEQIHVKRGDHIWRMLGFAALAIHWFNPLVWLAFAVSGKDMEMSCDEAVIRRLGRGRVKEYSDSLLALATGRHILGGAPLAFGEGDTGSRIRNVLRYKKPAAFVTAAVTLACVVVMIALATNPLEAVQQKEDGQEQNIRGDSEEESLTDSEEKLLTDGDGKPLSGGEEGALAGADDHGVKTVYDRIPEITLEEKYSDVAPEILSGWRTLKWGSEVFTAEEDGIYRTAGGSTERIFKGYVSILPNMTVYDGRLFFLVDTDCTSREDFTFYNDIRWVDLEQPGVTGLVGSENMAQRLKYYYEHLEEEEGMVNFTISEENGEGYITVWSSSRDGDGRMLLPVSAEGYRQENLDLMSEEERKAYGRDLSEWLLQNPGSIQNVSVRTEEETYAWLDLDGDADVERVSIRRADDVGSGEYNLLDNYILTVGEQELTGYGAAVTNNLLALSLDGEELLIAVYEDGWSGDPRTSFFRYDSGRLSEVGSIESDIRNSQGSLAEGGKLRVWERCDHLQTDWACFSYRLTADYRLERVKEESYELSEKRYDYDGELVSLTSELPVYDRPDGDFKLNLKPGTIFFSKIRYEEDGSYWLYITGFNGSGWIKAKDGNIVGIETDYRELFDNLNMAG